MPSLSRVRFVQIAAGTALGTSLGAFPRRSVAQALEQLVIAVIPSDVAAQAYYAQDLRYFKKAGIESKIMPFSNGATITTAVVSGSADLGFSNVVSLATAHLRDLPLTIRPRSPQ